MTITGTIETIEYRNTAGHEKKVVTLVPDHRQRAFVEFRGRRMADLERYKENDFMAFNNAFPAGGSSAPNYFASGGIVSREIAQQGMNMDELALKIAEANRAIPSPVVAVQDIINQGNSYVKVRETANF